MALEVPAIRLTAAAALLAVLMSACETAAPAATEPTRLTATPTGEPSPSDGVPTELKVAYIRDLAPEGALAATTPAQQAVELTFATASLQPDEAPVVVVVAFDTEGDPTRASAIADEIAADPAFVAAIAGPGLDGQQALSAVLGEAGIPFLSLSSRGSVADAPIGTWLRLVAPVETEAVALATTSMEPKAARLGICVFASAADGSTDGRTVARILARRARVTEVTNAAGVREAGCGVVVWTGDAAGGARLAVSVAGLDPPPVLVGGVVLREPVFLEEAGAASEGARSLCSCTDVSTSLDLAAQRFVQDFQSEYGSPPGPYAVEAWDGAHLLLRGLRESGGGREGIATWLAAITSFEGLAGTYRLEAGELADPRMSMRVYRVDGERWVLEA